jgi:hypothetical protein
VVYCSGVEPHKLARPTGLAVAARPACRRALTSFVSLSASKARLGSNRTNGAPSTPYGIGHLSERPLPSEGNSKTTLIEIGRRPQYCLLLPIYPAINGPVSHRQVTFS